MADLKQVLLTIRSGGLPHVLNILKYSLYKARVDRGSRGRLAPALAQTPGEQTGYEDREAGARFQFRNASLTVTFLAADLARLDWQPGIPTPPYAQADYTWPGATVRITHSTGGTRLESPELQLEIDATGGVWFRDVLGNLLRQDEPPVWLGDNAKLATRNLVDTLLCGLGTQTGPFNLLERDHIFWNRDPGGNYGPRHDPIYMPFPTYYALHGLGSYLVFFENSFRGGMTNNLAANPAISTMNFEGGSLRYYFIPGPPSRAMRRYSDLTGKSPLPPVWSLGYHQSRWGYRTAEDIYRVVAGFKEHNLPLSAIHLDIDYMDRGRAFTFSNTAFPSVQKLADDLHAMGIRLVTIVDPGIKRDPDYDIYQHGIQTEVFAKIGAHTPVVGMLWLGECLYPDFTHPHTRQWWGKWYERLLDTGVDGFWHDMNEPASFVAWGDMTLPDKTLHDLDGSPGDHRQAHNLYGFQMNRAAWEALRRHRRGRRPWILSRSGWAGSQRYAWNWTADTECTWEGLRTNLTTVLGLAMCGFAYSGPDIGGFMGNPDAELYLRWFQMAAFLPFFRTHSAVGTNSREPWIYGEPWTTIIHKFLDLRYALIPYFYTLAWQQSESGDPLIRPLFWHDPADPALRADDTAFYLGENLLVAPVLSPGCTSRNITLPGGGWYDYWNDEYFAAGKSTGHEYPVSIDNIPVFVRAGSIIPATMTDTLNLHIYLPSTDENPAVKPAGILYTDAGDGYGPYRVDRFQVNYVDNGYLIEWHSEGGYPPPQNGYRFVIHGGAIVRGECDGQPLKIVDNCFFTNQFSRLRLAVGKI